MLNLCHKKKLSFTGIEDYSSNDQFLFKELTFGKLRNGMADNRGNIMVPWKKSTSVIWDGNKISLQVEMGAPFSLVFQCYSNALLV